MSKSPGDRAFCFSGYGGAVCVLMASSTRRPSLRATSVRTTATRWPWCTTLERASSAGPCPGLMNAARSGTLNIANAVGNGVADDKLLYTYLPELIRYYLSEEPVLANVETLRLDDRERLEHVLERIGEYVLKPVDASGGKGIVIGPQADERTLRELAVSVRRRPRDWIAQRPVGLSTVPTLVSDGLRARHVDLRPFAVNETSIRCPSFRTRTVS